MISRSYVDSETTRNEFRELSERAKLGKLKLFPILLDNCDWKSLSGLQEIQIWASAKQVGRLEGEHLLAEFRSIRKALVSLIRGMSGIEPKLSDVPEIGNSSTETEIRADQSSSVIQRPEVVSRKELEERLRALSSRQFVTVLKHLDLPPEEFPENVPPAERNFLLRQQLIVHGYTVRDLEIALDRLTRSRRSDGGSDVGENLNPGTRFTERATMILTNARHQATKNARGAFDSLDLLFAFGEEVGNQKDTCKFVRETLESHGGYLQALADFRRGKWTLRAMLLVSEIPQVGSITADALDTVSSAHEIAKIVAQDATIDQEHLFAALLVTDTENTRGMAARRFLFERGLEEVTLKKMYRRFIYETLPNQHQGHWDEALGVYEPSNERYHDGSKGEPEGSTEFPTQSVHSLTLSEFFETEMGESMDEVDRAAFLEAAEIECAGTHFENQELSSISLLMGYLATAKAGSGKSEEALYRVVSEAYQSKNTSEAPPTNTEIRAALLDFRENTGPSPEEPSRNLSAIKLSDGLRRMLDRSVAVATEAERPQPFSTRHLLACLLGPREWVHDPEGTKGILNFKIDIVEVRRGFCDWIKKWRREDKLSVIESVLGLSVAPSADGYRAGTAGYSSEYCGVGGSHDVEDKLNVKELAHRLADLIALRETKLPLSIGLFGNWGSGKSHFMNLMDRQLKERAKSDAANGNGWCREIVPVYFNAWHYLDANLWASLVSQIFDELDSRLSGKKDALEEMQKVLENAKGASAMAAEELKSAQSATEQARKELESAVAARKASETAANGMIAALRELLPAADAAKLKDEFLGELGIHKDLESLEDLRAAEREVRSLGTQVHAIWNGLNRPGGGWKLFWIGTMIVGAPIVASLVAYWTAERFPIVKEWMRGIGQWIVAAAAFIGPLVATFRAKLASVREGVSTMHGWLQKAEKRQSELRNTDEYRTANHNLDEAMANEEAAKLKLVEAQSRETKIEEQMKDLTPGRRLGRFIEARAKSDDYRGKLGLISLARRDFEELSKIFADDVALKVRVDELDKAGSKDEARKLAQLGKAVDRIVLFVDDLDRCEPHKVVEVLQAVHLLLAFPLFAVVVGVDQRCLQQSLQKQFPGLLKSPDEPNGAPVATAMDYLEKIFHVPFQLPPMGDEGFKDLVEHLAAPAKAGPRDKFPHANEPYFPNTPEKAPKLEVSTDTDDTKSTSQVTVRNETKSADTARHEETPSRKTSSEPQPEKADEQRPTVSDELVGSVALEKWEADALKQYGSLIRTPRSVTRFLNTYRLIRAGIHKDKWQDFKGDGLEKGEFRIAMLMLAAAAGYPAIAREWISVIRKANIGAFALAEEQVGPDSVAWTAFHAHYVGVFKSGSGEKQDWEHWLAAVERFAF